jgi:hypothetical protein
LPPQGFEGLSFGLGRRAKIGGPKIEKQEGQMKKHFQKAETREPKMTIAPKRKYCICSVLH